MRTKGCWKIVIYKVKMLEPYQAAMVTMRSTPMGATTVGISFIMDVVSFVKAQSICRAAGVGLGPGVEVAGAHPGP